MHTAQRTRGTHAQRTTHTRHNAHTAQRTTLTTHNVHNAQNAQHTHKKTDTKHYSHTHTHSDTEGNTHIETVPECDSLGLELGSCVGERVSERVCVCWCCISVACASATWVLTSHNKRKLTSPQEQAAAVRCATTVCCSIQLYCAVLCVSILVCACVCVCVCYERVWVCPSHSTYNVHNTHTTSSAWMEGSSVYLAWIAGRFVLHS